MGLGVGERAVWTGLGRRGVRSGGAGGLDAGADPHPQGDSAAPAVLPRWRPAATERWSPPPLYYPSDGCVEFSRGMGRGRRIRSGRCCPCSGCVAGASLLGSPDRRRSRQPEGRAATRPRRPGLLKSTLCGKFRKNDVLVRTASNQAIRGPLAAAPRLPGVGGLRGLLAPPSNVPTAPKY